ncbi:hypothetical protein CFB89_08525 [Burkholderia sp. AU16741]|uniref:putative bifunctional diguanylate cyclase/phosphodiesterase n=1 Tax=Burkholderia sp. AU16741 TaxID=2015347 RepID=UPI000B7A2068|nr:EAL domain-containing protein [Burkholderia sp. AU16741]OXI34756.1 hypothetical protein CFB89_08525 [Burkholderia sp. AU16741]
MQTSFFDRLNASTRLRFRVFGAVIATLFCCSFAAVCIQLSSTRNEAYWLNSVWIANTKLLGEMGDRVTELRLAQAQILLARKAEDLQTAISRAAEHRRALTESKAVLAASNAAYSPGDLSHALERTNAYIVSESDWENSSSPEAAFEGETKNLYEAADGAIDTLIDANAAAAYIDTFRIVRTSRALFFLVIGVGILACAVQFWTTRRLELLIFHPLERITDALSRLSSGQEDTQFPVTDRRDEIGGLICAFQRFRLNTEVLRETYVATKLAEETATRLAHHDPLTGLFNRRHLRSRIDHLKDDTSDRKHFLYVIDLVRFKPINDLYGHAAGDTVLCTIANRLRALVGTTDIVARHGGDEFALLVSFDEHAAQQSAEALAIRVIEALRAPFDIERIHLEMGGSIGVAMYARDGSDADSLVRSADAAMYRAKGKSICEYQFFEESMREELRKEAELEIDIRTAVTAHAICPYYQPLVDLSTREIHGFEVLARWTHPTRGPVTPEVFVPVIERLGLAASFTLAILRQACRDARQWPGTPSLAVNVSPQQLADAHFPAQILSILNEEDFPPERLEIEMTESALVGDIEATKSTIENLQRWGIRVSLDDFGTGYASLHHLRELHFDKVKIDKSFIQSMLVDRESEKIVDAMLSLVSGLGLSTLAEGIETIELEDALRERGCTYGQGYLFGKAVTSNEAFELLRARMSSRDDEPVLS